MATNGSKGSGGEVVLAVAVGECQGADSSRIAGGEDLSDRATGVVGDHVHLVEAEMRAQLVEPGGVPVQRQVVAGRSLVRNRRATVGRKVGRDAAPGVCDVPDDVAPQIGIDEHAMDEEGRRRVRIALVDEGDGTARELRHLPGQDGRNGGRWIGVLGFRARGHSDTLHTNCLFVKRG
jgi:hypothetical protein